jgi:hypothetical protein
MRRVSGSTVSRFLLLSVVVLTLAAPAAQAASGERDRGSVGSRIVSFFHRLFGTLDDQMSVPRP